MKNGPQSLLLVLRSNDTYWLKQSNFCSYGCPATVIETQNISYNPALTFHEILEFFGVLFSRPSTKWPGLWLRFAGNKEELGTLKLIVFSFFKLFIIILCGIISPTTPRTNWSLFSVLLVYFGCVEKLLRSFLKKWSAKGW